MEKRIDISKIEPDAFKAMFELERYLSKTALEQGLKELIKIRASQINGCAYCIQMHTEQALNRGETQQRIFALSAWKESPLFSDKERAVLRLTEEVTLISDGGLAKKSYEDALIALGEQVLAQAIIQITTINTWNKIAIATHMMHD